jgi:hypothetical protein
MASLSPVMLSLWVISAVVQITVFFLVFANRYFRTLPLFAIYVVLNLIQAALLVFVYSHYGFRSDAAYEIYWISEPIVLIAQALAAMQLIRRFLRHYPGIWGLAWRVIAVGAVVTVSHALASAERDPSWRMMIANRGYHLTFAVALISCLLLIRFYAIPVNRTYRILLAGFCFASCEVVAADTLLQMMFLQRFPGAGDIWNYIEMAAFIGVQIIWVVALWQPAQAEERRPSLLPASEYEQLSPDINSRLRKINDVLNRFWRMEATR